MNPLAVTYITSLHFVHTGNFVRRVMLKICCECFPEQREATGSFIV
jgi:hypothetical protein